MRNGLDRSRLAAIAACLWITQISSGLALAASEAPSNATTMGTNPTRDMMLSVMGGVLPPGVPAGQLPNPESEGARILQKYCVQCHELPSPALHAPAEWPGVISRMQDRIIRMSDSERATIKVTALNTAEITGLLRYMKQFGFQIMDEARYPDIDTDIGKAFRHVCSQCHALPDPAIHTSTQWSEVVQRMRRNMNTLGAPDPGDDALAKALSFLQVHTSRK